MRYKDDVQWYYRCFNNPPGRVLTLILTYLTFNASGSHERPPLASQHLCCPAPHIECIPGGDTQVVHRLFSTMPHSHAKEATESMRPILMDYYMHVG
ncbi:hypothetical protein CDL15_Pgr025423 [Punica granatum]|uniref:Uncharacterized protein n=1 Tax=Punica granatum TaxID=22663 RepID=A0A218W9A1_PUNGR|nr:hypothetical protein CDL15_Pgr025423 [Punica granatum]